MANTSPTSYTFNSDSVVILPRDYSVLTRRSQYRNSRTGGARTTRTQIDHDVFEGLPVRHWRKRPISISTAPEKENTVGLKVRDLAWPELEMPRDSHLLSEMSQNLLRAARMPQAKKVVMAPLTEDDKDAGEEDDARGEVDVGFVAKRWAVLSKDLEGPEPEFLAKRRKGLPSMHGGTTGALGISQQMRKTKIRKLDTNGSATVLEVLVPEGQTVDGEIFEEETSPSQAPAPGTVVEGVGVANAGGLIIASDQSLPATNRRRPPPPNKRRRAKGSGRSKRKRAALSGPGDKPVMREVNGIPDGIVRGLDDQTINGGQGLSDHERITRDEPMSQEGGQESDDGSEEGSEIDEGEDDDREEGELSPSRSLSKSPAKALPPNDIESAMEVQNKQPVELPTSTDALLPLDATTDTQTRDASSAELGELSVNAPHSTDVSTRVPSTKVATEISPQPATETSPDHIDDMPIDNESDETSEQSIEAPANGPLDQALTGNIQDPVGESLSDLSNGSLKASTQDLVVDSQGPTDILMGEVFEETLKEAGEEPSMINAIEPLQEAVAQPFQHPELELQSSNGSKWEIVLEHAIDVAAEPVLDSVALPDETQAAMKPVIETVSEHDAAAVAPLAQEVLDNAEVGPIADVASEPMLPRLDSGRPDVESNAESIQISTPAPHSEDQLILTTTSLEDNAVASVQETPVEAFQDSIPPIVSEHFPEPPAEPAERRFSFTRPTASPKAPTPSPPTPIEDKFALRAPYVSPKAPTMSPPTPIDRSMPSSPDIPLADQQFALPPPLDPAQEGEPALAPSMQHIPNADHLSVEAAPYVEPGVDAQIPPEHDPLDGLAEPKVADDTTSEANGQAVHFSDGEEDLLGSLERSLDQRGREA